MRILGIIGLILGEFVCLRGLAGIYLGSVNQGLSFLFAGLAIVSFGAIFVRGRKVVINSDKKEP